MTDEQRTVEQHLWSLFDSFRGRISVNALADTLLWNAADWRTRTTGLPAPEIGLLQRAAQHMGDLGTALDPALESEREVLHNYTPAQIRHYARTLLRPVHHHDEFPTSASLVKVATTALTAYERGSRMGAIHLYDPACGSATLALDVAETLVDRGGTPASIAGQDVNSSTVQRARAHAFLVGADAAFSLSNSLEEDAFPGRQFDYTVAEIPYNMSWRGSLAHCAAEAARLDGRFPAGLPQPDNASPDAVKGRIRWSDKLRQDHRLLAALEKLMQQLGPAGSRVPVKNVAKVVPFVGVLIGAGMNSAVLGNVAADARRYCQTRFLCDKYGLPLPAALATDRDDDPQTDAT
jgi:hypothetical protein